MSQKPITNHRATNMFVSGVVIPPGETKVFEETDLPPHLQGRDKPAPAPVEPADRVLQLLDQNVSEIIKAIEARDANGNPEVSDDEVLRLKQAEEDGKTRKTLMKAIDEEWVKRANDAQQREDHMAFVASLADMPTEQLAELKTKHQEEEDKVLAIALEQVRREVNQAVEQGDREYLTELRGNLPGDVEVPAALELIHEAQAKLEGNTE